MSKYELKLASEADFARIKESYLAIIDRTPDVDKYLKWEYGKHPSDKAIKQYIEDGNMYMFMDGDVLVGVTAITYYQGEDYCAPDINWKETVANAEVMVLHLLAILPEYQGSGAGKALVKQSLDIAKAKGMKACRLDALSTNVPAHHFYEKLGFKYCGKQNWYAENTGWIDFFLFEYEL